MQSGSHITSYLLHLPDYLTDMDASCILCDHNLLGCLSNCDESKQRGKFRI
eukprot:c5384_g2_i1 orf=15-167(-)